MFFCSPRFELPMGASEQPPLPQQNMNQTKVRGQKKKKIYIYTVQPYLLLESHFFVPASCRSLCPSSVGRRSL